MATNDGRSNKETERDAGKNPFKSASLTPMKLRNDPARKVRAAEIRAVETPMVSIGDHSAPAAKISEHRFDFAQISEVRPDLKLETSLEYRLRPITVTPVQMQQLRERRIASRDLGWSIPGHRIRIET